MIKKRRFPAPDPESTHMFYQTIKSFPEQLLKGWQIGVGAEWPKFQNRRFRNIYYSAMGGSSFPADLVNDFLFPQRILTLVRDYRLPAVCGKEDLVFSASFSGNTEETLAVFQQAVRKKMSVVALANGGGLKELAASSGEALFLQIPDCLQPRLAAGYFFSCILGALYKLGYIESKLKELEALTDFLCRRQSDFETLGEKIAKDLVGFVPMIYGPGHMEASCRVWKIKFNENVKIHSFYNIFPEINHNEMIAYSNLILNPAIIYLISRFSHERVKKRMAVMKKILLPRVPVIEIPLSGTAPLEEIFESLAVSDYTSYYLAKIYGNDPEKVEMIEDFKTKMMVDE